MMDQRKGHFREPAAVMDFRAVFIFLCLLIAQAACGPVGDGPQTTRALNKTVQQMRQKIRAVLDELAQSDEIPNIPCPPLDITELVGPEPLTANQFSSICCLMLKMSELIPELSSQLLIITQESQSLESLASGHTASRDCSLPSFEEEMYAYVHVKCLLPLLDQRLSKANF